MFICINHKNVGCNLSGVTDDWNKWVDHMKDLVSDPGAATPSHRKLTNPVSGLQISCVLKKTEGRKKTGVSSLLWEWREAPTSLLYLPVDSASPAASARNATAAELQSLPRSSPGFILTVPQDGPQFRTQRLGQTSRRCSLSLTMIHSFSSHCVHLSSLPPSFYSCTFPSASPRVCISFPLTLSLTLYWPPLAVLSLLFHYHKDLLIFRILYSRL